MRILEPGVLSDVFWNLVIFGPVIFVWSFVRTKLEIRRRAKRGLLLWRSGLAKPVDLGRANWDSDLRHAGDDADGVIIERRLD